MILLYRFFLACYRSAIRVAAATGNTKAQHWLRGLRNWKEQIAALPPVENRAWFHCASLGEFEQGRPVLEHYRKQHPHHRIVLTFFSPSGYEVRKNYPGADYVFYLPYDSPGNADFFLDKVRPGSAFF